MTPEAQRIAIAEACGWKSDGRWWSHPTLPDNGGAEPFAPEYTTDLNAMHEAENVLTNGVWTRYCQYLAELGKGSVRFVSVHATAAHRAEAFLRVLNLWDDSK